MVRNHASLAVLVSGKGTTLQSIIDFPIPVRLIIADRNCKAIAIAEKNNIPVIVFERTNFKTSFELERRKFTEQILAALLGYRIGIVASAGFKTVLSEEMFTESTYQGRVLNVHPSLIPDFPGNDAVTQTLRHHKRFLGGMVRADSRAGCTVHIVTKEIDSSSTILSQKEVPIRGDDTKETLHARIQEAERSVYPGIIWKQMHEKCLHPSLKFEADSDIAEPVT